MPSAESVARRRWDRCREASASAGAESDVADIMVAEGILLRRGGASAPLLAALVRQGVFALARLTFVTWLATTASAFVLSAA